MDTPARLRVLAGRVEDIARLKLQDPDDKDGILELIDFVGEKITKHRDILPHSETLSKLRSGKVRREKRSARHVGESRVLTYKHVNAGLKKLAEDLIQKVERERVLKEKKKAADEKKAMRETLEAQWKIDRQQYDEITLPA